MNIVFTAMFKPPIYRGMVFMPLLVFAGVWLLFLYMAFIRPRGYPFLMDGAVYFMLDGRVYFEI